MTEITPPPTVSDIRKKMRRLALPLIIGFAVILALVIATALLLPPVEVAFVANLVLLCTCLVPMIIVFALVYMGVIIANVYMARANRGAHAQLSRLYGGVVGVTDRVQKVNESAARRAIGFGAQAAKLDVLLDAYEQSTEKKEPDSGQIKRT